MSNGTTTDPRLISYAQALTEALNNLNQTTSSVASNSSAQLPNVPAGASVQFSSAHGGATNVTASFGGASGVTTYLNGFIITSSGSTSAAAVNATVSDGHWTLNFAYVTQSGVTTSNLPYVVNFPTPLPATTQQTAITITLPSLGTGNTQAAVVIYGFDL
ncbi:MAG TPA: hypothetical protein VFA65_24300 [Bryobacteraceae bacterium]|nr:hypothetical protein [Bryobacteraceae bacterium]